MIYFDNAATTKVYQEIIDSFNNALIRYMGNSSSTHKEGLKALELEIERCKKNGETQFTEKYQ